MTKKRSRRLGMIRASGSLTWALTLMLAAAGAQAQHQIQDGRKLDNNLQSGSGGVNPQAAQPDYRLRNDLITGNVPGMDYFRGNVGYRAASEFAGRLGDDAMYRFNARSYPLLGSPGTLTGAVPGAWTGVRSSASLSRGMSPTSAGDLRLPYATISNVYTDGLIVRPSVPAAVNNQPSVPGATTPQLMGYPRSQDGRMLETTTSPLPGINQRYPNEPGQGMMIKPGTMTDAARPDGRRITTGLAPTPAILLTSPTADLGQLLQAQLPGQRLDDGSIPLNQKLAQIQAAIFSPLGSASAKPGEDVYLDILNRIKLNQAVASGAAIAPGTPGTSRTSGIPGTPGTPGVPGTASATVNLKSPISDPATSGTPGVVNTPGILGVPAGTSALAMAPRTIQLESPDPKKLAQARRERDLAMSRARGLPDPVDKIRGTPGDNNSASSKSETDLLRSGQVPSQTSGKTDSQKSEPVDSTASPLNKLIESMRYDGPGLMTLAGTRDDLVNKNLRQAEQRLAEGQYFDAEASYRQAAMLSPGHPLARVGMIHAQMGAGLIRSSASQLRALFQDHPELIGMRYQATVLPPDKRVQWIRQELEEMIRLSQTPEPALLLAYLGYQVRNDDLLNYGLDLAESRAPLDPLFPVLRKIWLAPSSSASPATGSKNPSETAK